VKDGIVIRGWDEEKIESHREAGSDTGWRSTTDSVISPILLRPALLNQSHFENRTSVHVIVVVIALLLRRKRRRKAPGARRNLRASAL